MLSIPERRGRADHGSQETQALPAMRPSRASHAIALGIVSLTLACQPSDSAVSTELVQSRTQRGDTAVVRTISGSTWGDSAVLERDLTIGVEDGDERYMFGSINAIAVDASGRLLVLDGQARSVRVYDSTGAHLADWGRDGAGPGEFRSPDAGLAVLSNGDVVVRDPGNARMQKFSPDGTPRDTWSVISGQWRSREPLFVNGDTLLTLQPSREITDINNVSMALVRIAPNGAVIDTLALPVQGAEREQVTARRGNNNASLPVPWTTSSQWTWHPRGYFVSGNSDAYRITLQQPQRVLQIERDVLAQRVADNERAQETERVTAGMRWLDSSWTWNGAPIPDTKPAFEQLFAARDGRVWVLRAGAAVERATPETDDNGVVLRYTERRTFDVFEEDGTFLGSVAVPDEFGARPAPVFARNAVWAVVQGANGEPQVARFRLVGVN